MPSKVHIVTDSAAHFWEPDFPKTHKVTVLPLTINYGQRSFRDGLDINSQEALRRAALGGPLPTVAAPTVGQLAAVYEEISQTTNRILSLHSSSKLTFTVRNARAATDDFLGRSEVVVLDSLTTSVGLGILVQAAAEAAERGEPLDEVVRAVRRIIPHLYVIFFAENLIYLEHTQRIGRSQATLGAMLGIKPIITIEEGDIVPIEKVRTRSQAIEKLIEFVSEFSDIRHLAILHGAGRAADNTRLLLERLAVDLPGRKFPVLPYSPTLAAHLGPDSMGIFVCEGGDEAE